MITARVTHQMYRYMQEEEGVAVENQVLLYAGETLSNYRKLADCRIGPDAIIHFLDVREF
jgi:hypothetical protein